MNEITFNPDGGDLGRGIFPITPLEFQLILPHISYMLEGLYQTGTKLRYKYGFEFNMLDRKLVEMVILQTRLPPNVKWYETDGMKLFKIHGPSGGITASYICYLITGERNDNPSS
jgi:hypothetical protein